MTKWGSSLTFNKTLASKHSYFFLNYTTIDYQNSWRLISFNPRIRHLSVPILLHLCSPCLHVRTSADTKVYSVMGKRRGAVDRTVYLTTSCLQRWRLWSWATAWENTSDNILTCRELRGELTRLSGPTGVTPPRIRQTFIVMFAIPLAPIAKLFYNNIPSNNI